MKYMKKYAIVWTILIVLFNLICFFTPNSWYGMSKFSGGFWAGYCFITIAFVLHLFYALYAFREKSKEKRVLNTPLTIISIVEFGLMIVAGLVCMIVPALPFWVGIIICYAVLAFSVIYFLSAKAVGENTSNANTVLNQKTSSMRFLTDKAQALVTESKDPETKRLMSKVFDAIKYSDTVSTPETQADESAISDGLSELEKMILENTDTVAIHNKVTDLLLLIENRNNKCKALKWRV